MFIYEPDGFLIELAYIYEIAPLRVNSTLRSDYNQENVNIREGLDYSKPTLTLKGKIQKKIPVCIFPVTSIASDETSSDSL